MHHVIDCAWSFTYIETLYNVSTCTVIIVINFKNEPWKFKAWEITTKASLCLFKYYNCLISAKARENLHRNWAIHSMSSLSIQKAMTKLIPLASSWTSWLMWKPLLHYRCVDTSGFGSAMQNTQCNHAHIWMILIAVSVRCNLSNRLPRILL